MKAKYVLTLLAAIFLIAVAGGDMARAQEPAPPPSADDFGNTFSFFVDGGGFLGVYGEDITRDNMAHYHLSEPRGVGITQVMNESPAQKAGLRNNDVILRLDGENVTSVRKLNRLVSEIAPDHVVKITISRNGAEQELTATIGKRNNLNSARDLFSGRQPRVWKWEGPRNSDKLPNMEKMPNGEKFTGPSGLRQTLLAHSEQFVGATVSQMMTYALGRPLDARDQPTVRRIVRTTKPGGYRFADVVLAIVESTPFQAKQASPTT